jgi:hypothetical protein
MGVIISPESELGKELQKWEQFPRYNASNELIPAGNPYQFRPYPKMLYKAFERPNGKIECLTGEPNARFFKDPTDYDFAMREAAAFNRDCHSIVKDAQAHEAAKAQGWRDTPQEAIAYLNGLKDDIARAAAEAAYTAKGMTEKARGEFDALTDATSEHVVDVKGTKKGAQAVTK